MYHKISNQWLWWYATLDKGKLNYMCWIKLHKWQIQTCFLCQIILGLHPNIIYSQEYHRHNPCGLVVEVDRSRLLRSLMVAEAKRFLCGPNASCFSDFGPNGDAKNPHGNHVLGKLCAPSILGCSKDIVRRCQQKSGLFEIVDVLETILAEYGW